MRFDENTERFCESVKSAIRLRIGAIEEYDDISSERVQGIIEGLEMAILKVERIEDLYKSMMDNSYIKG